MGMGKSRRHLDFPEEPLGADLGGDLGSKDLEGDLAVVTEVPGQEDQRHPPFAQFALEGVSAGKSLIQSFLKV
jgi:hypothetical protein